MMLPEENFGRQLSRLIVMSVDEEFGPVALKEDGLFVTLFLFTNRKIIFGDILGFEHIMKALFGEQVTKLL